MSTKPATNSKRSNKSKKDVSKVCVSPETTIDANSSSALDPEAEDRFELELCWCIQRLEASLTSGKLQKKQTQDVAKHLNSLKSNSAPLIKKRQIMRNAFGDYRQKMAEDERKLNKTVSTVKFTNPAAVNKKSLFIKKAVRQNIQDSDWTGDHNTQETLTSTKQVIIDRTQTPFQFNFQAQ